MSRIIKELTPSKRKNLYRIVFEGGESVALEVETVLAHHLKAGDRVDSERWEMLCEDSAMIAARRKAFNILGYHAQSSQQLYQKLQKEFGDSAAAQVVARMQELGLLDDEQLLTRRVEQLLTGKKYGHRRVVQELMLQGFDRAEIEETIQLLGIDEFCTICDIIDQKYADLLPECDSKEWKRIVGALMRRGFDYSDICRAINEYR